MEKKISSGILVLPGGREKCDIGQMDWSAISEEKMAGKWSAGPGPWYPKVGIKIQGRESWGNALHLPLTFSRVLVHAAQGPLTIVSS